MSDELEGEKILMTGGTGFLGRAVLNELILRGAEVIAVTRKRTDKIFDSNERKIESVELDLLDHQSTHRFLMDCRPDKIVHLAGDADGKHAPADLENINFHATANLLELARKAKVKRIIITGTADEYGFQPAPHRETMPAMPVSDYAISKHKAVEYALAMHEKYHLPVVVLRPFTIYGVGQAARMFVAQAVESAVEGVPFAMSNGVQKRDLVFVTDFADAMMKAITAANIEGEVFNVGSGAAVSLKELALKIWQIAGADLRLLKIGARPTGANELHDTQADISKIYKTLGWKPKISLDEGLNIIIANRSKQKREHI